MGGTEAEDPERKWHQETQPRQNHCDSVTVIAEVSQKHAQDKDSRLKGKYLIWEEAAQCWKEEVSQGRGGSQQRECDQASDHCRKLELIPTGQLQESM